MMKYVEADMGVYTLDQIKKSVLVGTAPYLEKMGVTLTPAGRQAVLSNPARKATHVSYTDNAGKKRCTGGPELKETENYSMSFGAKHAVAYQESCGLASQHTGNALVCDTDSSDSEIGDVDESCFLDFKDGFTAFQYTLAAGSSRNGW